MRETVEYPRNIKDCPHEPRFGRNARGIATDVDKRNLRNGHDGAENPDTVYRLIEQSLPPRARGIRLERFREAFTNMEMM